MRGHQVVIWIHYLAILYHDVGVQLSIDPRHHRLVLILSRVLHVLVLLLLILLLLEHLLLLHLVTKSLLLCQNILSFEEPFGVPLDITLCCFKCGIAKVGVVLARLQLLPIECLVLLVHLAHLLDLVEVDYEARLVRVVLFDALAAEHSQVVGTIEVLHSLVVLLTYQAIDAFLVFKVDVAENWISLH